MHYVLTQHGDEKTIRELKRIVYNFVSPEKLGNLSRNRSNDESY